jgi:flagellar hook-associated protein FlgK
MDESYEELVKKFNLIRTELDKIISVIDEASEKNIRRFNELCTKLFEMSDKIHHYPYHPTYCANKQAQLSGGSAR